MDLQALAAALQGPITSAPNYGANINDTAAVAPNTANIRNLAGLDLGGDNATRAINALGAGANEAAEQDRVAIAAANAAREAERKRLEELNDPKNWKAIVNDRGGYDFFDAAGNKVSAVDYARKTNTRVTDLYKDSEDPDDRDFLDDYETVTKLGKAIQSGDKKARDEVYKKNPEFKEAFHDWNYADIVKELHKTYPSYFRSEQELERSDIGGQRATDIAGEEDDNLFSKAKRALGGLFR